MHLRMASAKSAGEKSKDVAAARKPLAERMWDACDNTVVKVPGEQFDANRPDGKQAVCYYGRITGFSGDTMEELKVDIEFRGSRNKYWYYYNDAEDWIDESLVWGDLPEVQYIDPPEQRKRKKRKKSSEGEENEKKRDESDSSEFESESEDSEEEEESDEDDIWTIVDDFKGPIGDIFHKKAEPKNMPDIVNTYSPYQLFLLFFDRRIVKIISEESTRYLRTKKPVGVGRDISEGDIYAFVGALLYMSHIRLSRMDDYFGEHRILGDNAPDLEIWFSRERFYEIKSFLHFANDLDDIDDEDPLRKIRPVVDHFNNRFQHYWQGGRFLSCDEKLVLFKGRSKHRRRIPNKPKRCGLKFFMKNCANSFFCLQFVVDVSQELSMVDLFKQYVLAPGQVVVTDRYFTTVALARDLLSRRVGIIGTCQRGRFPCKELIDAFPLCGRDRQERGTHMTATCEENDIGLSIVQDNKPVPLVYTYGTNEEVILKRRVKNGEVVDVTAPRALELFCNNMGGVDANDHLCADYYSIANDQRCRKWTIKAFMGMIDITVANCWIIYRHLHPQSRKDIFYRELYKSLLRREDNQNRNARPVNFCDKPRQLKKSAGGWITQCKCRQCNSKSKSMHGCKGCNVALHKGCFHEWHVGDKKVDGRRHKLEFEDSDSDNLPE